MVNGVTLSAIGGKPIRPLGFHRHDFLLAALDFLLAAGGAENTLFVPLSFLFTPFFAAGGAGNALSALFGPTPTLMTFCSSLREL